MTTIPTNSYRVVHITYYTILLLHILSIATQGPRLHHMSDKLQRYQLAKRGMQMMFFEEEVCIQELDKITERLRN